jgi:CRP-like cAMP-binding protein
LPGTGRHATREATRLGLHRAPEAPAVLEPQAIRRIPRFAGLSPEAERWLCERAALRSVGKGETIFLEGDPSSHFYMVLQGEVKVFKMLESGRELILDLFRDGESFGEVALVDGSEFPASAVAMEPSSLLALSRKDYLLLLERFPEVARSIIRDLTLRMHALRRRVEVLGEMGVQSRIANLLLIYARQLGQETPQGLLIPLHLSRNEVASLVSARVETVIRIMSRWQKEGLVLSVPDGFLVPDGEALEALTSSSD